MVAPGVVAKGSYIPCPKCSTFIHPLAQLCPHCQAQVASETGLQPGELEGVQAALATLTSQANEPADTAAQPAKFGLATQIWGAIFVGLVTLALLSSRDAAVAWAIFATLIGVIALILFFADLAAPSVRKRRTGPEAIRCYFTAVRRGRWKSAFACLSPIARGRTATVPAIPELQSHYNIVPFEQPPNLKTYWAPLARSSGGMIRRISNIKIGPALSLTPDVDVHSVTLKFEFYSQWVVLTVLLNVILFLIVYAVTRRTREITFPVAVVKNHSQWWLVTGEAFSPIDRALRLPSPHLARA
jgi:hypothetical protein